MECGLKNVNGIPFETKRTSASFAMHLAFLGPRQRFGVDGKNETKTVTGCEEEPSIQKYN